MGQMEYVLIKPATIEQILPLAWKVGKGRRVGRCVALPLVHHTVYPDHGKYLVRRGVPHTTRSVTRLL